MKIEIHKLYDAAGPAGIDPDIQAILFTSEASVNKGVEFVCE